MPHLSAHRPTLSLAALSKVDFQFTSVGAVMPLTLAKPLGCASAGQLHALAAGGHLQGQLGGASHVAMGVPDSSLNSSEPPAPSQASHSL